MIFAAHYRVSVTNKKWANTRKTREECMVIMLVKISYSDVITWSVTSDYRDKQDISRYTLCYSRLFEMHEKGRP